MTPFLKLDPSVMGRMWAKLKSDQRYMFYARLVVYIDATGRMPDLVNLKFSPPSKE